MRGLKSRVAHSLAMLYVHSQRYRHAILKLPDHHVSCARESQSDRSSGGVHCDNNCICSSARRDRIGVSIVRHTIVQAIGRADSILLSGNRMLGAGSAHVGRKQEGEDMSAHQIGLESRYMLTQDALLLMRYLRRMAPGHVDPWRHSTRFLNAQLGSVCRKGGAASKQIRQHIRAPKKIF